MPIMLSPERDGAIENKWDSVPYERYVSVSSIPTVSRSSRGVGEARSIDMSALWNKSRETIGVGELWCQMAYSLC